MQLSEYLELFPGATRNKARFIALAEAVLRQVTDLMALPASIPAAFSFTAAEGRQLDAIAEAAGLRRKVGMTDEAFRAYALSKLKLWTWDGTNAGAAAVLLSGVTLADNGDGTVTVSPAGTEKNLLPVPVGVGVR